MAELRPLDVDTWPRYEHFRHYRERVPCSFEMTVDLDVTAFVERRRAAQVKTYPAQIWAIAAIVNRHDEFRMQLLPDGSPGMWDVVHPEFTVFHAETETFSTLVVPFDPDFRAFHDAVVQTTAEYADDTAMAPQPDPPVNMSDVSSVPWTSFTGFALHIGDSADHLLPIVTLGRYRSSAGRTLMPLALQCNHAAADGFHAGRFVTELQELFDEPGWLG